jgi:hypothetical protein
MEARKLTLFLNILKFALIAIGVIASLLVINGPNMEAEETAREAFRDGGGMSLAINYTIFTLIATTVAVLGFFALGLITNTKKTVFSIIGIVVAFVLFMILWMMGSSDTHDSLNLSENIKADGGTISFVTAGLYTTLVGLVIAALAAVAGPFMGRLRK